MSNLNSKYVYCILYSIGHEFTKHKFCNIDITFLGSIAFRCTIAHFNKLPHKLYKGVLIFPHEYYKCARYKYPNMLLTPNFINCRFFFHWNEKGESRLAYNVITSTHTQKEFNVVMSHFNTFYDFFNCQCMLSSD